MAQDGSPAGDSAERIFVDWLARREDGTAEDLDALAAAHPQQADELRRMHAGWRRLAPLLDDDSTRTDEEDVDEEALDELLEPLRGRGSGASRYRVEGEIGRGGMGVVLRVWDSDLERPLALKRVRREDEGGSKAGTRASGRFLEEARVTGQLDHPGIVPVHELGLDDTGRLYFTMRLVRGRELGAVFRLAREGREGWSTTRCLGVLLKACEALSYAHSKGVTHRDLKPANVMVGRFGEVYVMDWGVARVAASGAGGAGSSAGLVSSNVRTLRKGESADGSPLLTREGDVVGTVSYMAPEQALGGPVGPHSDVYAMGAILYELLTGRAPYCEGDAAPTPLAIWSRLRDGPPAPVHALAPSQPLELVAICEKAMAREIGERYPDVRELADDLQAYLENRVVKAHRTGAWVELTKWVARNRSLAAAVAASLLLALGGLASTSWVQARGRSAQERLNTELRASNADLAAARDAARGAAERADAERDRADLEAQEARVQRDAADRVADFLVGLFRAPDPNQALGEVLSATDVLERGAEALRSELGDDPLVRARLLAAIGAAQVGLGGYEAGEALLREAVELRLEELGPSHGETLVVLSDHASVLRDLGRYDEAERILREVLATARETLGEDHPRVPQTLLGLGRVELQRGDREAALAAFEEARERAEGVLEPDSEYFVQILAGLARLMPDAEAEPVLRRVLELERTLYGDDHPQTLATLNNLASCVWRQVRYDEAGELFVQLLEDADRVLGPEHPNVLIVRGNLASVRRMQGDPAAAEDLCREALAVAEPSLGEGHPIAIGLIENLGSALAQQGRLEEAEECHLHSLELYERALGADSEQLRFPLTSLCNLYARQERWLDLEPYLDRLLTIVSPTSNVARRAREWRPRIDAARAAAEAGPP